MGARLYESDGDRERERCFLGRIEERFRCEGHKLPTKWELDYLLARKGNAVAFAELKCRNIDSAAFPTLLISEHKMLTGLRLLGRWANPVTLADLALLIFVRYKDCDKYTKIESVTQFKRERLAAKNHIEDPTDTEWVIHVPNENFVAF